MKKQGKYSSLLSPRILKGLLSFSIKGYFLETGWLNSYLKKQALSVENSPIPWLTYSFLDFLEEKKINELSIFEYGSGNSTIYFSKKTKYVRSIEHDKNWYNQIKKDLPPNSNLSYVDLNDSYENKILEEPQDFDIILIDGRKRIACIKNAVKKLSPRGIIILDDSERKKYAPAFDFMNQQNFKHIPFSGIAIGAIHRKCTSLFYKSDNVLDI